MADLTNRDELERKLARELGKLQRAQLMRLLEHLGDPPKIENVPAAFWDEVGRELAAVVRPLLQNIYLDQAQSLMGSQPIGVDWALVNERASTWARQYTFDLVRGINQTTRQALQAAVSGFFEEGLTIGDLEDRISGLFGPVRAEMIAVTEVTRAAVEGERSLAAELFNQGIQMIEVWQTSNDELVCPICAPKDGKAEGDGWSKNDGPPAHPRCRCWTNHELPQVS
jgi:hypothetical protein